MSKTTDKQTATPSKKSERRPQRAVVAAAQSKPHTGAQVIRQVQVVPSPKKQEKPARVGWLGRSVPIDLVSTRQAFRQTLKSVPKAPRQELLVALLTEAKECLPTGQLEAVLSKFRATTSSASEERKRSQLNDRLNARQRKSLPKGLAKTQLSVTSANAEVIARLREQSTERRLEDVHEGRLIPTTKLAELLHVQTQTINAAKQKNRLFSFRIGGRTDYYPAFFADESYQREHLEEISVLLGDLPAASKLDFFTSRKRSLSGDSPLDALKKGLLDEVRNVALSFREI